VVEVDNVRDSRRRKRRVAIPWLISIGLGVICGLAARWAWREFPDQHDMFVVGLIVSAVGAIVGLIRSWILRLSPFPGGMPDWRRLALVALALVIGGFITVVPIPDRSEPPEEEDACGREPAAEALEVIVVWDDRELAAFCDVVGHYGNAPNDVEVASVGTEIGAELDQRFDNSEPPDVAIIPQPSLVRRYGQDDCLVNLGEEIDVGERFPSEWNDFVTTSSEAGALPVWGAFVKGADKSMFWYSRTELDSASTNPQDWSWSDLTGWMSDASDDSVAPLALPAADRWPLTDWFENQLAAVDPDLYRELSRGEVVDWSQANVRNAMRSTLEQMVELWDTDEVLVEGVSDLRLEDVDDLLRNGEVATVFAPSFLAGQEDLYQDDRFWVFGFPSVSAQAPRIVGGDVAVVPRQPDGNVVGDDFVDWLTSGSAMRRWSEADPGFLTPNLQSPYVAADADADDVHVWLTSQLLTPQSNLLFDLSDDRLAAINQHDPHGSWDIFADFFADVTSDNVDEQAAIDEVISRLEAEYDDGSPPDVDCDWP
jgi:hypothetical protein